MSPRPPRSTRTDRLFPHRTLFRSISESINETAGLDAATSRTVHYIGGATNNAAEEMGGIDKAVAEVADHIHLLERTVKRCSGQGSDERSADEASARI